MPYIETEARYENTTMKEIRNNDDILTGYDIAPIDGYVLHNKVLDSYDYDEETGEDTELSSKGYSKNSCSVEPTYDFDTNPDEIYAIAKDDVEEGSVIY